MFVTLDCYSYCMLGEGYLNIRHRCYRFGILEEGHLNIRHCRPLQLRYVGRKTSQHSHRRLLKLRYVGTRTSQYASLYSVVATVCGKTIFCPELHHYTLTASVGM